MLRKIINLKSQKYIIHIPKEYLNRDIEILVLPYDVPQENQCSEDNGTGIVKKTAGILKGRNIDPLEWQQKIRSEWD